MTTDVRNYCKSYYTCQACKMVTRALQGQLQPLPVLEYCWQRVNMDHIACLPKINHSVDDIAAFIDCLSKYTYFVPINTSISADDLAQVLILTAVAGHGVPQYLISNRDLHFVSAFWKRFMSAFGAQVALSKAYHPQMDGQSECQHHSLEQIFRCFVSSRQHIQGLLLLRAEFDLNNSHSALTGFSLAYMLYGCKLNLPLEAVVHSTTDSQISSILEYIAHMSDIVQSVCKTLAQTVYSMDKLANRKHCDIDICMGDKAWISIEHLRLQSSLSYKFAPRFVCPFSVLESVNPALFHLTLPAGWHMNLRFHVFQLNPTIGNTADLPRNQVYSPPPDESSEFEIKDIMDVRLSCSGLCEFCVLWKGYGLFESMWEVKFYL